MSMCLPSAPAFGAGAPESLAAEPVSLEAARWGDDAARWVRQLVHSNAARQVRTQSAPALIGFDTARGDNAIVGGGGALALTLSHGTRWTSVLPPDSVFVVSIGEPVVVASDMLAAGWCDTLAQGHALAALTVLTLDAVAQFRHKLVVAPAAKHAPRAVLRECMGALEVFGVSSCGGLMTPSEKELEWIANSSTATADAQHPGSGSAPNAAVGRGRDVGDDGRASASSPISLANALFAMARVTAAGTSASAFASDVRTSDAAGWLGGVVGDGGSAATPLDIAYAAVRLRRRRGQSGRARCRGRPALRRTRSKLCETHETRWRGECAQAEAHTRNVWRGLLLMARVRPTMLLAHALDLGATQLRVETRARWRQSLQVGPSRTRMSGLLQRTVRSQSTRVLQRPKSAVALSRRALEPSSTTTCSSPEAFGVPEHLSRALRCTLSTTPRLCQAPRPACATLSTSARTSVCRLREVLPPLRRKGLQYHDARHGDAADYTKRAERHRLLPKLTLRRTCTR